MLTLRVNGGDMTSPENKFLEKYDTFLSETDLYKKIDEAIKRPGIIFGQQIALDSISEKHIKDAAITTSKLTFSPYVIGISDLDNIDDGIDYAKVLNTAITAGLVLLSQASGDLDDISDGTYGKVLSADITAGHILMTSVSGDLDDIANGGTYGKVALTNITAGMIVLAECTGDLDDIAEGTSYGKVALTSITAGKIIVAGLDAGITARMFGSGTIKTNIEAWRHAGDTTLIDGGDIYTDSIVAASVAAKTLTLGEVSDTAFDEIGHYNLIRNSVFNYDGQTMNYLVGSVEPAFWDVTKSAGTFGNCLAYAAGAAQAKAPWDYVYNVYQTAIENDGTDYVLLLGSEYIPVDRDKPYTLSIWIKRHSDADVLNWHLGLNFYDSDKAACTPVGDYPASMEDITDTTTTWTRYSGTFGPNSDDYDIAFPADCAYVKIRFLPMYGYGSGSSIGSLSTGLQLESGDKLTDWKAYRPDYNETVLDLWQGEADTQIFRLRSTNIDHEITQGGGEGYDWGTHTDCYFYLRKYSATLGGMHSASFTEDTGEISWEHYAIYGAASTDHDTTATGAINFASLKADPANNTYKECAQGENIFCLKTKGWGQAYGAIFIIDEDGDYFYDGAGSAFQDEDDVELLGELEEILTGKITKKQMKQKKVFTEHGVVNVAEVDEVKHGKDGKLEKTGKKRLDRFVSNKKLNRLYMGCVRQLGAKSKVSDLRLLQLEEKTNKLEERLN